MKCIKKLIGVTAAILASAALIFTGCNNNPGENPGNSGDAGNTENTGNSGDTGNTEAEYELTFAEDLSALSVYEGEELTLTVSSVTGTWGLDDENLSDSIEVVLNKNEENVLESVTVRGVNEAASVSFTLFPEEAEDTSYDVEIAVKVINPMYSFTLTLDETLAAAAATIEVKYSSSTHSATETATVTYTAGDATATVKFNKSVADEWGYFNGITVTVKNADEETLLLNQSADYFEYTNPSFEKIDLTATTADVRMTLVINLTNMESAATVKVVTVNSDDSTDVAEELSAEVSEGTATFEISKHGTWEKIKSIVILDDSDEEITGFAVAGDDWWEWADNGTVNVSYVLDISSWTKFGEDISYTGSGALIPLLTADEINAIADFEKIKITVKVSAWAGGDWYTLCADENWTNKIEKNGFSSSAEGYFISLDKVERDAFLAAAAENGIYLGTSAGQTSTITIEYQ